MLAALPANVHGRLPYAPGHRFENEAPSVEGTRATEVSEVSSAGSKGSLNRALRRITSFLANRSPKMIGGEFYLDLVFGPDADT